ncbi:MAG: hypothetical protein JRK53_28280 [Deltaproteobacteria bacterium]|nr:hypothetical protein [Deltaproteobacteria bacterium]
MPTIRIDEEVYEWLKQHAQPFEDTPNSVLRRIAELDVNSGGTSKKGLRQYNQEPRRYGEKTPQAAFRKPILRILRDRGGSGSRKSVLRQLEIVMSKHLSDFDKSDISSGSIRWQKSAEWEVRAMRERGILKPVSGALRGVWALSESGKKMASDL